MTTTNIQGVLEAVRKSGVHLFVSAGKLNFRAPRGAYTPALREMVSQHRGQLIAALENDTAPHQPHRVAVSHKGEDTLQAAPPWPADLARWALHLTVDDLPAAPFGLGPAEAVVDATKFLAWLQADVRLGRRSPRAMTGALQAELAVLHELLRD